MIAACVVQPCTHKCLNFPLGLQILYYSNLLLSLEDERIDLALVFPSLRHEIKAAKLQVRDIQDVVIF